jgi:hypothetical protein
MFMNKQQTSLFLTLLLLLTVANKSFAEERDPHIAFFKADHKSNFFSKLFNSPLKTTHAELMITPSYRKDLLDKTPDIEVPEWDQPSVLTRIIIFKTPSYGFMDSAKNLRPIRFGLANSQDQLIINSENEGLYELTDDDVKYLEAVYGVVVDKKNRHSLIAFYQPVDLMNEDLSKRLIAFEDTKNNKVAVTILKYNRDFYSSLIRTDYKWFGVIGGNSED